VRTSLVDVTEGFIDFLSFLQAELLRPGLKDLLHGSFGVAIEPDDPALRVESRIGGTHLIELLIAMIKTHCYNDVALDTFDKRFVKIFAKIFRAKVFCILSYAFYLVRVKET
jgi:hypothetical protein